MKYLLVALIVCYFCQTEGRFGLKSRSLFDDDFFLKPWSTFDMMSRDFEDEFYRDDPFFDDFGIDDELFPKLSQGQEKTKDNAGKGVCDKGCEDKKKGLVIPKLSSRVILNNDKEFKFAMNVKGFNKKEISVKVLEGFLKISGKKNCKETTKKCGQQSIFRYQYLLPKHTSLNKVKARFSKDGFLIVEIPKLEKLEDASNDLHIEEMDEEYLPKLENEMHAKSKAGQAKEEEAPKQNEKIKFTKEEEEAKSGVDDAATIEVIP